MAPPMRGAPRGVPPGGKGGRVLALPSAPAPPPLPTTSRGDLFFVQPHPAKGASLLLHERPVCHHPVSSPFAPPKGGTLPLPPPPRQSPTLPFLPLCAAASSLCSPRPPSRGDSRGASPVWGALLVFSMAPPTPPPAPRSPPPPPPPTSPTPLTATSWPAELRPIAKYLARAEELADTYPTVAFGCRLTALSVALATPGGGLSPTSGGGGGGAGGGGTTTPATALLRTVLATAEAARSAWAGPVPLVTAAAADTRALVAAVTAAADADLDAHRGSLDTARAYYAVTVLIDVLGCLAGGPSPPAAPVGGGGGGHATASPAAGGAAAGCPAAGAPADDGATADRARYAVAHIMKALADGGPAADGTVGPPPASAWAACRSAAAAAAAPGAAAVAAALAADATVEPPALTAAADALARHRGGGGAGGAPPSSPPSSSPPSSPATPAAAAAAGAGASLLTAARATKKAASALDFGDAPAARRCLRAALRALDGVGRGPADGVGG